MNEENGGLVYVKQNLTRLRPRDRRRCGSDDNRFDVAVPRSLEIRKNSQNCHTNNDHQHQDGGRFRKAGRLRFSSRFFWHIHAAVSE